MQRVASLIARGKIGKAMKVLKSIAKATNFADLEDTAVQANFSKLFPRHKNDKMAAECDPEGLNAEFGDRVREIIDGAAPKAFLTDVEEVKIAIAKLDNGASGGAEGWSPQHESRLLHRTSILCAILSQTHPMPIGRILPFAGLMIAAAFEL